MSANRAHKKVRAREQKCVPRSTVMGIKKRLDNNHPDFHRMPAFFSGTFGHKPSRFLVPVAGFYPGGEKKIRFVTAGPMCRLAEDMLPMLKIIAGKQNTKLIKLDKPVDFDSIKLKVFRFH